MLLQARTVAMVSTVGLNRNIRFVFNLLQILHLCEGEWGMGLKRRIQLMKSLSYSSFSERSRLLVWFSDYENVVTTRNSYVTK